MTKAPVDGGMYAADQNADGTWNVRGVPVFAEHERFGHSFDAAWISNAVSRATELYSDGYLAPLHVGHHPSLKVERAGWFKPTRVETRAFAGRPPVAVMFADLLSVPANVYSRLRAGGLPYCSVEVLREGFDEPEIKSLALLEHEAPFFAFPLITVGRERGQRAPELVAAAAPVVACYNSPRGASALFRFVAADAPGLDERGMAVLASALEAFRARVSGSPALRGCAADVVGAVESALAPWTGDDDDQDETDSPAPAELPAAPPSAMGFSSAATPLRGGLPPEVAAYSARDREVFAEAIETWRTWEKTGSTRPLEQYLAINVDISRGS